MPAQLTLAEVLAALKGTLNSFQVRALTAEIESVRHNIVTVVEFSRWPVEVLQRNLESNVERLPGSEGPLSFSQGFFTFADWDRIAMECSQGNIRLGNHSVEFACLADPGAAFGWIPSPNYFVENTTPWPMFQAVLRAQLSKQTQDRIGHLSAIRHSREAEMQMSRMGYASIGEFLHQRFGAFRDAEPEIGAVYIVVHVPAVIHDVEVQPATRRVVAHMLVAPEIEQDVWIRGLMRKQNPHVSFELAFGTVIRDSSRTSQNQARAEAEWDFRLPFEIELRLVHRALGIVNVHQQSTQSALPEPYRNPLFSALELFCSREELAQMLVIPVEERRSDPKPQRALERNIQWLLSAYGYIAVNLGDHEHLHDRATKVRVGSLDILAYHPNDRVLLLASCTLKAPDEGDYSNLVRLRTLVSRKLGEASDVKMATAIFTTSDGASHSTEHRVCVFGGTKLAELVSDAASPEPRLLRGECRSICDL